MQIHHHSPIQLHKYRSNFVPSTVKEHISYVTISDPSKIVKFPSKVKIMFPQVLLLKDSTLLVVKLHKICYDRCHNTVIPLLE